MKAEYILLTVLFLFFAQESQAQEEHYTTTKSLERAYAVDQGCYVEVVNKYGDIDINTWDEDSVKIEVSIKTISEKLGWREEMMSILDVEFTRTSGFVIAETVWKDDAGFWRKSAYNVSKQLSANRIEVDYVVYLPKRMPLEIRNQFGNVFMRDFDGELDVELRHGDFRARDLSNVRNLEVRYGRVKVNKIEKGQIEIGSGSSLDLRYGGDILLTSASSEVEIGEVKQLNVDSKHDDFFIDDALSINGSFSLSDILIRELRKEMVVNAKFGSVRIQEISVDASQLVIEASKSDVIVGLPVGFAGRFNIEVDEDEQFVHPQDMYTTSIDVDGGKRKAITATLGDREGTKVSISSTNGSVSIGE